MTTIEFTATTQAYCRGCATPTFMFDPDVVHPAHLMYCDNCYGTRMKYNYDEECEGCGDCDGCEDEGECENLDMDNAPRGNTNRYDSVLSQPDFNRLMSHRNPGKAYVPLPVEPTMVTPPVFEESDEEEVEDRPGILEHTCRCGSTEFRMFARDTVSVAYERIDLNALADEPSDYEIEASADGENDEMTERDYNETDETFECCCCGRAYQGGWCS